MKTSRLKLKCQGQTKPSITFMITLPARIIDFLLLMVFIRQNIPNCRPKKVHMIPQLPQDQISDQITRNKFLFLKSLLKQKAQWEVLWGAQWVAHRNYLSRICSKRKRHQALVLSRAYLEPKDLRHHSFNNTSRTPTQAQSWFLENRQIKK